MELNLIVSEADSSTAVLYAKGFAEIEAASNFDGLNAAYPTTVAAVADFVHDGDDFGLALGDFLDYAKNKRGVAIARAIKDEPSSYTEMDNWQYAYLAAVADEISNVKNIYANRCDVWFRKDKYCLDEPWFPENTEGDLRLILWLESPAAFRKRGLFVSENVMSRV